MVLVSDYLVEVVVEEACSGDLVLEHHCSGSLPNSRLLRPSLRAPLVPCNQLSQ